MNAKRAREFLHPAVVSFGLTAVLVSGVGIAWGATHGTDSESSTAATDASADNGDQGYTGALALSDFPTNSQGLTYGSDAEATSEASAPDLIAVVGDHRVLGFVYADDLYGPKIQSPEEALAYEEQLAASGPRSLRVYDVEGKLVVDTFTLTPGRVIYEAPPADASPGQ